MSIRRLTATAATVALVLAMGAECALAAPPPPPNPSDSELGEHQATASARAARVGRLTNEVAEAEARLMTLQADVELKLEDANKALVDLSTAQDEADRARADARAAKAAANAAADDVDTARAALDEFAASSYRQGSMVGSLSAYLGATSPRDVLDRAQLLNAIAGTQLDALEDVEVARTAKANSDSAARAALATATEKEDRARAAKATADAAVAAAEQAQHDQLAQARALQSSKALAERQLAKAQSEVSGLEGQRQRYREWLAAKQQEDAANAAAVAGSGGFGAGGAGNGAGGGSGGAGGGGNGGGGGGVGNGGGNTGGNGGGAGGGGGGAGGAGGGHAGAPASGAVRTVINRALSQLGVPYAWGGGNANGPTQGIHDGGVADSHGDYDKVGFDCSGLMIYAFAGVGIHLPHYSGYQYNAGRKVPLSKKRAGDMLFWATSGGRIHHVALYIGGGQMVEAPYSGSYVRVTSVRYGGIVPYATRLL